MRTCEEIRSRLSALLDGELTERERRETEEHLAGCPDCRGYLADLTAMQRALRSLDAAAPEGFDRRVMDRVRETAQERPQQKVVDLRWRRWAAAAACCAVVAAGAFLLWRGGAAGGSDGAVMMARTAEPDVAVFSAGTGEALPDSPETAKDFALPAEAALKDAAAAPVTLTTSSEVAGAWVEEHLGLAWTAGAAYTLTAEEYADLRQALLAAGADFTETGSGDGYLLSAG